MQDVLFDIVFFRLKEKEEGQINDNLVRYLALCNMHVYIYMSVYCISSTRVEEHDHTKIIRKKEQQQAVNLCN